MIFTAFACLSRWVEVIANVLAPFASVRIFTILTAFLEGPTLVAESIFRQEVALFAGLAFVIITCLASIFSRTFHARLLHFIIFICEFPKSVAFGAFKTDIIVPALFA